MPKEGEPPMGMPDANEGEFFSLDGMKQEDQAEIPEVLPVLPVQDAVVFPYTIVPLLVSNDKSIEAIDRALTRRRMLLMVTQHDGSADDPAARDLYEVGTVGVVIRMLKLPDKKVRILVQGIARARVRDWREERPYLEARVQVLEEYVRALTGVPLEALRRQVAASLEKVAALGKNISQEVLVIASNLEDPGRLADLVAGNLSLKPEEAQEILAILDAAQRLQQVHEMLTREEELLTVQQEIDTQARDEIDKGQREFYLRHQLKAIQSELGEGSELAEEVRAYRARAEEAKLPPEAREEFDRQVRRLERMMPEMAEAATVRTYLDWMVGLPWAVETSDNLNLREARRILDEDHYGLDRVKDRILEHLAVRKLKKDSRGPILCFVGPPGTGKTSLGRSIARALGRSFFRMSLGGVRDEAEIRGHRRTYIGSMPGRIIQGIHTSRARNPVFMMDEVDKLGIDFRGDPSSALLEVLDPEQNSTFRDNYLGVPFDLSGVLFITTANMIDTVQPAFRDRMEVITLPGYMEDEKMEIARRHLVPRQIRENGLPGGALTIPDPALREIIRGYTREAGLRNLEREIASLCRKTAMRIATGRRKGVTLTAAAVRRWLGPAKYGAEERLERDSVGIATGLGWTPAGGAVIYVEAQAMKGKGGLLLTGQMGGVMQESAHAALSYARAHAAEYGIDDGFFANHDIHIHIPEGAIPKDGPSAGVTLAAALVSVCTGRPVRKSVAMTGEITLRGDILPVGGVREKILAAHLAHVATVLIPRANLKDLHEIPKRLRDGIDIVPVRRVQDVLARALV
jgi:ATP-dependent Lon protease